MNKQQKDALTELAECEGCVDDNQYSDLERAVMEELAEMGLVTLSWRFTPRGKEEAKKP